MISNLKIKALFVDALGIYLMVQYAGLSVADITQSLALLVINAVAYKYVEKGLGFAVPVEKRGFGTIHR